ncbi:putative ferric-chelate reductase 1 [Echeneis naucrates]|uniref:putative ferric-chelate reductase 1 n=1 Tax=Echeneis naucrates TaxID=173247 RepID=UPI0011142CB9|nr:putative ferric-chelate reductase 1 [Echeneis naucrates]
MERSVILLVSVVFVISGVQGDSHLLFSNATVNVTQDGCGITKLCLATPSECDPAGNGSCQFMSIVASNSTTLSFEIRGETDGYIGVGLTKDPPSGVAFLYLCTWDNSSTLDFRTFLRAPDGALDPALEFASEIRGTLDGRVTRCEFEIPDVNATILQINDTTEFAVLLGTGVVAGDNFGIFNTILDSNLTNLAALTFNINTTMAPTAGITTAITTTTTITTVPAGASSVYQPHAVLLLSVVTLSVKLRA